MVTTQDNVGLQKLRITGMFVLLLVQYPIGVVLSFFSTDNPIRLPLSAHIAFFIHVVIAILLFVGGFFILLSSHEQRIGRKASLYGLISIFIALASGVIASLTKEEVADIASFFMAISFLAAFLFYGYMFFLMQKGVGEK